MLPLGCIDLQRPGPKEALIIGYVAAPWATCSHLLPNSEQRRSHGALLCGINLQKRLAFSFSSTALSTTDYHSGPVVRSLLGLCDRYSFEAAILLAPLCLTNDSHPLTSGGPFLPASSSKIHVSRRPHQVQKHSVWLPAFIRSQRQRQTAVGWESARVVRLSLTYMPEERG